MTRLEVLVVDDRLGARTTLRDIIEGMGVHVQAAEDGYQAIEAARESPFDLAFIDIEMPGINGLQTLRELLKLRPRMVAVMMTGYGEARLVKEAMIEGAVAVLLKPFDAREISHFIGQAADEANLVFDSGPRLRVEPDSEIGCRLKTFGSGAEYISA